MKYSINNERLNNLILNYISEEYIPDYGWGDSYHYKEEVDIHGEIDFLVNDYIRYSFNKKYRGFNNILLISHEVVSKLTSMFGNIWVPLFAKWVSENISMTIQSVGTVIYVDPGKLELVILS